MKLLQANLVHGAAFKTTNGPRVNGNTGRVKQEYRLFQLDYEHGTALFSMNNSLHNPVRSSHALHKNTFPIFLIRAY